MINDILPIRTVIISIQGPIYFSKYVFISNVFSLTYLIFVDLTTLLNLLRLMMNERSVHNDASLPRNTAEVLLFNLIYYTLL